MLLLFSDIESGKVVVPGKRGVVTMMTLMAHHVLQEKDTHQGKGNFIPWGGGGLEYKLSWMLWHMAGCICTGFLGYETHGSVLVAIRNCPYTCQEWGKESNGLQLMIGQLILTVEELFLAVFAFGSDFQQCLQSQWSLKKYIYIFKKIGFLGSHSPWSP